MPASTISVVKVDDHKKIKPSSRCIHMHNSMVSVGKNSKLPKKKTQLISGPHSCKPEFTYQHEIITLSNCNLQTERMYFK